MEARKVQLSGGTTYTVSLPKAWAEEHDIETGTHLHLFPNDDGTLRVEVAGEENTAATAVVDVSGASPDRLRETTIASYVLGFDRVRLTDETGFDGSDRRAVREMTTVLTGIEVTEVTDTRIVVRGLVDASNVSVTKTAIRLRLIAEGMHRDAVDAVCRDDAAAAREVIDRDDEADRLFALVSRQFQRSLTELDRVDRLDTTRGALFDHYYLCRQLERVADLAVDIAALVERQPHPPGDEREAAFRALARDARNAVTEATSVTLADAGRKAGFRARDVAADAISEADRLDRELYADSEEAYVWSKLLEKLTRTAEHGRNVAELGVRHCLRE